MEGSGQKDIRIVVEDENSLYSSFSPDDEFNEDEERFRAAVYEIIRSVTERGAAWQN